MATLLNSTINLVYVGGGPSNPTTNTAFGRCSLRVNSGAYRNVAVGYMAMCKNTGGDDNVGAGYKALFSNTTGLKNTAVGFKALYGNTTANNNTAIGNGAMQRKGLGDFNTAVGYRAQYGGNGCTQTGNTFVGTFSGQCTTTACYNTGIGHNALKSLTSGDQNTGVGYSALCSVTTGTGNIGIGKRAGYNTSTANQTISIGQNAKTSNTSYHTVWGNSSITNNWIFPHWTVVSDCRDKTAIQTIPDGLGLNFVRQLQPVSFNWDNRQRYVEKCNFEFGTKDGTLVSPNEEYGFLAQDLRDTLISLNLQFDALGYDAEQDGYRLQIFGLISPIVRAIQQTHTRLATLEQIVG